MTHAAEERVLSGAPVGRDAGLAAEVLARSGISCLVCRSLPELMRGLDAGVGAVLSVEEVLSPVASMPLVRHIAHQAPWSDLPIPVLTGPGGCAALKPDTTRGIEAGNYPRH